MIPNKCSFIGNTGAIYTNYPPRKLFSVLSTFALLFPVMKVILVKMDKRVIENKKGNKETTVGIFLLWSFTGQQ